MMIWYFIQTIAVFGLIGWGAYVTMKKLKKNQFSRVGQKGKMEVLDGLSLNHQTSAYLVDVEEQRLFVVVGDGGIDTVVLKDARFKELMKEELKEVANSEN